MITIYTLPTNCIATTGQRIITARFKNPARSATIAITATAWDDLVTVPDQYRAILDAVLENAAKTILSKHLSAFSIWPSTIDAGYFSPSALMDEATNSNNQWLSKEELQSAWTLSATRKQWIEREDYKTSAPLRKAVARYEEIILKLSGKTSQFTPDELDLVLAKMKTEDLTTELGSFVVRRIDAIKNRPVKASDANVDLL